MSLRHPSGGQSLVVGYLGVCLGERSRWDTHRCRCLGVLAESIERAHSSGLGAPTALPEELDTSTHLHIVAASGRRTWQRRLRRGFPRGRRKTSGERVSRCRGRVVMPNTPERWSHRRPRSQKGSGAERHLLFPSDGRARLIVNH